MKKLVLGILLASSSFAVMADESEPLTNWVNGISYLNLSDENDESEVIADESEPSTNWVAGISYINIFYKSGSGFDISFGGIIGSLGHKIKLGNNFYLIPEVRIGTGIHDDSVLYQGINVDIGLDGFLALSLRGQFELDNGIYLFAAPTYTNVELTATASLGDLSASATGNAWEFGIGGGVGYNFSQTTTAEFMYEKYNGVDMVSFGTKYNF